MCFTSIFVHNITHNDAVHLAQIAHGYLSHSQNLDEFMFSSNKYIFMMVCFLFSYFPIYQGRTSKIINSLIYAFIHSLIKSIEQTVTAQKMKFPLRISSINVTKLADLVIFTEDVLYGQFHFLCRSFKTAVSLSFSMRMGI